MNHPVPNNSAEQVPPAGPVGDILPVLIKLSQVFRYRKRIILYSMYCFALAGAIYYFVAPRYYESAAKLLIVEQQLDKLSAVGDHESAGKTMATHRELVVSPVVISNAIRSLPPQHRIDLLSEPPRDWVKTISKRLSASTTRKTNFIDVSFRSLHPETAATVVNAVIQSYLGFVEKNHKGTAGEIIQVLTDERDQLQNNLNEKQEELQAFRRRVGHLSFSAEDGVVEPMIQRALSLNEALIDTQQNRLKLQSTLASIETAIRNGEDVSQQLLGLDGALGEQMLLATIGLSQEDMKVISRRQEDLLEKQEKLQSLTGHYGPRHPSIIELKQQIQNSEVFLASYHSNAGQRFNLLDPTTTSNMLMTRLRQSMRQAQREEQQLLRSYEQARVEASNHSDAMVELHMLERDVLRKEALYDSLSEKIASIDISQVQAPIKATVVREPIPGDRPVTPRLRFVAIFSVLGGAVIGGLIAYVQDLLDDRFNSPEELTAQLDVPVLAMVRNLDQLPGEAFEKVHTHAMPSSVETEAFRTLRTAISLSGKECDRILVSSSEPGDGKTTITANLSVALAQAGKRTLVIDADLRRPGFTALANLKGQPGVSDVLTAELPVAEIAPRLLQQTEVEGLDVLPVGPRRPNPAELLSRKAFVDLLAWADSQYDRVIVDCPPVLAVSDAQIVGQLVDGAVLVVRPEKNHRRSVIRAVTSFKSTGCHVLGIVANGISVDTTGYDYGYSYGGYGHEDPSEDSPAIASPPITQHASVRTVPSAEPEDISGLQAIAIESREASADSIAAVIPTRQVVAEPDSRNIRPRRAA